MDLQPVLSAYNLAVDNVLVQPLGNGLINHTWLVQAPGAAFVLQRVNTSVFGNPQAIARNIRLLADYLAIHHPDYPFVAPVPVNTGGDMVFTDAGCFRLFPYVAGSHSIDVATTPDQAFEAAVQFGRFTRLLTGFDVEQLAITIPDFHNLSLRYRQFMAAVAEGNPQRLETAASLVAELMAMQHLVIRYERICNDGGFRQRVIHHDTKVSNVLFDASGKGMCVIDLDTVMPGYFLSDVGDMMRTYLSPVSEEEPDCEKIEIRPQFHAAIVEGYLQEMGDVLSAAEHAAFDLAGPLLTYMQALRFLTDYLRNDVYYGERYPGHNLVRATNQATLLKRMMAVAG